MAMEMEREKGVRWYAVRAFWNKTQRLMGLVEEAGYRTYYAVRTIDSLEGGGLEYRQEPLVAALFFIQCPVDWLLEFQRKHYNEFMIYTDVKKGKPAAIRDKEMDMFIMVTSAHNNESKQDIEILEPKPQYAQGDWVRVTDGVYKGATGIVKRIKKDRKLLVAITGVTVVAISHIPMCYLEKLDQA